MGLIMRKENLAACIITLFLCMLFSGSALAVTNIDSTFGEDGVSLLDSGFGDDKARDIAVQSDGKIIVVGYVDNGAVKNLAVSRFLEDGEIDTSFSTAGTLTLSLGTGDTSAHSVVIQDDDKIVISGTTYDDDKNQFVVTRLKKGGFLDTSFNTVGYKLYATGDDEVTTSDVILITDDVTTDDDIIASATVSPNSEDSYGFVVKLDTDGYADSTFDTDGEASITFDSTAVVINAIRLQDDGKILAGGSTTSDGSDQASLLRINADGSIDTDYGSEGRSVLSTGGTESVIYDLAIDDDSNVIAVGSINNGDYNEAFIAKLDETGDPVTDFGTSGYYTTNYALENIAYAVTLQDDDTITATGFVTSSTSKDIFVLNLTENSSSQIPTITSIATDIVAEDDVAYGVASLDDGNILVAGASSNGDDLDFAVLRFTDDPTLASSSSSDSNSTGVTTSGFKITTTSVTGVTRVSATSGGKITQVQTGDDDLTVTQRGVVYGTSPNPEYDTDDSDDSDDSDATEATDSIFPDSIGNYIVRLGYTEDGSDTGQYTSEIDEITPGTKYYARAYALLSDDTVIYGNQLSFNTTDACFIATAAYGSILEKHVVLLRQFRDSYLLTNEIGQQFVAMYYHFSPPLAETIKEYSVLKFFVRAALFPLVALAYLLLKTTLIFKLTCLLTGLIAATLIGNKFFNSNQVSAT
ncbi:MAG: putative delta-60 repeat protein [Desulforhopalus sp.]|jgi:uncharacterized delta-60 repeat protein